MPPFEHVFELPVRYGDTDQMGVVYYANYLRYFEVARGEWLRAHGLVYRDLETDGFLMPVIEANVRYRRSARYDDELDVECGPENVRAASARFQYVIRRGAEIIAEGFTGHACVDRNGRPVRFPPRLRALLLEPPSP